MQPYSEKKVRGLGEAMRSSLLKELSSKNFIAGARRCCSASAAKLLLATKKCNKTTTRQTTRGTRLNKENKSFAVYVCVFAMKKSYWCICILYERAAACCKWQVVSGRRLFMPYLPHSRKANRKQASICAAELHNKCKMHMNSNKSYIAQPQLQSSLPRMCRRRKISGENNKCVKVNV